MSDVVLSFRGRQVRSADVLFLRELIAQNPTLSRRRLSVLVCQAWDWFQPNGLPRDMVCRSLLLVLHRAGHIQLPAKRQSPPNNAIRHRRVVEEISYPTLPIEGSVASLGPLQIQLVRRAQGESLFAHLLNRHHYLGYSRPVGEHLKYLVLSRDRPIACLAWSSAPLRLNLRDQFIGAPKELYQHNIPRIAYNSRYLILPWVRVPRGSPGGSARTGRLFIIIPSICWKASWIPNGSRACVTGPPTGFAWDVRRAWAPSPSPGTSPPRSRNCGFGLWAGTFESACFKPHESDSTL